MFEQFSYKQKNLALVLLFVLLSITAYKRSFSNLIAAYNENKELTTLAEEINKKSKNLDKLSKEIALYDNYLGNQNVPVDIVQQEIVNFSTTHSGISINDLQSIHTFEGENYKAYSIQLDVIGNLNDLLKLAYDFETQFNSSRVVSTKFYKTKKNNTVEQLHLKIVFQNYEMIKK
jgi:hypothetical protein